MLFRSITHLTIVRENVFVNGRIYSNYDKIDSAFIKYDKASIMRLKNAI